MSVIILLAEFVADQMEYNLESVELLYNMIMDKNI